MNTIQLCRRVLLLLSIFVCIFSQTSRAATLVWTNTAGGLWSNTNNWSPNVLPTAIDTVVITNAGTYTVTNNATVILTALTLGDTNTTGTQTLLSSVALTVTNTTVASNGVLFLSAGTFTTAGAASIAGTFNQAAGTWQLNVAANINNYNLTNGELRGANCVITNFNWQGGQLNSDALGSVTTVPIGGTLTIAGATAKSMSYWVAPGRTLNNFGTGTWTGAGITGQGGATINNGGTLTLNGDFGFAHGGAGAIPVLNNTGTLTKATGTGAFTLTSVNFNNFVTCTVGAGSFAMNSCVVTNLGGIYLSPSAFFDLNAGTSARLDGILSSSSGDHFRFQGATVTLATTNITTPSLLLSSGLLNQNTNFAVNTLNQLNGTWQLNVPVALNNYNLTNGELRGANCVITNFNWQGGQLNSDALGSVTTVPIGGTLTIAGATAKSMSYWVAPGRTLNNFGTGTWTGAGITGQGGATINNGGTLTLNGDFGFAHGGAGAIPVLNNTGTLTKATGTGAFTLTSVNFNNFVTCNISAGSFAMNSCVVTNLGGIYLSPSAFFDLNAGTTAHLDGILNCSAGDHFRFQGATATLATTNITTPSLLLSAGQLNQNTNVVVNTMNQINGTWQLNVPVALNNFNQTNGDVRGRSLTVTNWNWFAGHHYRGTTSANTNDDRTIIPVGGVMNLTGTDQRNLSYLVAPAPGRGLDNFGTINWSGSAVLASYGTVNNHGTVNVTASGTPQYYSPDGTGHWNNQGSFTRTAGTLFYFQNSSANNTGTMDIQSGTLSIYNSGKFTNSAGLLNVGVSAIFQTELNGSATFSGPSQIVAPTANSLRFNGASATIETTNIISPSLWLQAGFLFQRTNIAVSTINQSSGSFQLDTPCFLSQFNQTNGDVRGRSLTVTNWNWLAGHHYRGTTSANTNDDRTIIPVGGVMNLTGTDQRNLSYLVAPAPGRGLDNFGTINWSGSAVLSSYGTVNNHGTVNVTASGTPQYYSPDGTGHWNNQGSFTRTAGTLFYFQNSSANNTGTMDIQSGTLSIYNSGVFTNTTGLLNLSASAIFQTELNGSATFSGPSQVVAPTANSLRFNGASATIETTNIISPSLWLQAGFLFQRTNIAVATINQSSGSFQLDTPCFLSLFNQTNGDVRGRSLTVTNWNWLAGHHYRGTTSANTNDDRTIIPVGGVMNLTGVDQRVLSYLVGAGPGRGLDNFGTVNWSGSAALGSYGTVNNHGAVNITASGTAQYYGPGNTAIWNNYGTFTRTNGSLFYFQSSFLNNSGLIDIQSGTLSIYNSATFTNLAGGNVLAQPGAVLANDLNSTSSYEAGSSLACASTNAFQINSGTVTLRTTAITAPSMWINGGTLNQNAAVAVPTINESSGVWRLNVPASIATYNLTNGELRGANLTIDTFNWLGGNLNSENSSSNTVTISAGGTLNISSATAKGLSDYSGGNGRRLVNQGTGAWSGGNLGVAHGARLINQGSLTLTSDAGMVNTGGTGTPAFENQGGTFTKTNGTGVSTFSGVNVTNSGNIQVTTGGITFGGPFVQTAGNAYLGTNFTASSSVSIQAGSLNGRGTIAGAFYNNGTVNPGASPGFIAGSTFTNTSAATYNVEIGGATGAGTNYDQLRFTGPVTLDGTLNVSLFNNYALILSNRFTVLTTSARSGTFASVVPPPGATLNTIYSPTNVVLEVVGLTNAPLQILTHPVSQTIWTPDPVTFSAAVSGVTPITYQWQFNSNNIPNATNISYTIPAVAVTNAGLYTLLITDGNGGTTNTSATLTVIPFANTITWTNVLGGNWSVPANWLPNRIPNATNNVVITTNGTYTVTVDIAAACSNLTVGAASSASTQTVHLVSGQSLGLNGSSTWTTNTVFQLNGTLQTAGGSNDIAGRIEWQLGTLSGAGRTVIRTNATVLFVGSLNQKFIATNILENYGTLTYGGDSFGNAQLLRFSGGAQLTNYPSGLIYMGANALQYHAATTPRSYLVNLGKITAGSANVFSPSYISIDFLNYGTLTNNGYIYLSRGTNYGVVTFVNTLCELSAFGDETTGEYFSFEDGTTFVGAYPALAIGGYAQWNTTAVHPGKITVLSGSGGASFANPEFRVLKNYTQTGQTIVYKGRWTQANPALTADLNELSDSLINGFHTFTITNAGTLRVNNLSHTVRNFGNSGAILVRSNLTLSGSSYTYGGGSISITNNANATFSGGTVEAQTILNRGTNVVNGALAFTANTAYRNFAGARTYFGGGTFTTGPASVLNEGLLHGFGGMTVTVTNRASVLADDFLNRNLALGTYTQESGLTSLNPGQVSGDLNILGGLLTGAGTITGNVRNAATVAAGNPFGLLSITGNYTNAAAGTYILPINGIVPTTNFPQTRISGTNVLAGTLSVNFTNGFTPAPGNLFTAMTFTARSGVFDSIVNDTYGLEAFYTSTTLVLRAENLLPNVSLVLPPGNSNLVCKPFEITASATDADGIVTNLTVTFAGSPFATSSGAPVGGIIEKDFPGPNVVTATAIDDRGGVRTVTQNLELVAPFEVLVFGGIKTNAYKICMGGYVGTNYTIVASTNLLIPVTNWVNIGPMEYTNGIFRYFDNGPLTNRPARFYRAKR